MTFDPTAHPRGQADNAGKFRARVDGAPTGTLIVEPSATFAAAQDRFHAAQTELRREAVREMLRSAPAGTAAIVFELYSEGDPDAEMLAFSHLADEDGEPIEVSAELSDYYYDLASRIDHTEHDTYGFTRDGEVFTLEVTPSDPAVTASVLDDAVQLHTFATFNAVRAQREETDQAVHTAAANHIRALASQLTHPVDSVILTRDRAAGLRLIRTENADGQPVHDDATYRHPSHAADRAVLDEISATACHLRVPSRAGLTGVGDPAAGTFRLPLNP